MRGSGYNYTRLAVHQEGLQVMSRRQILIKSGMQGGLSPQSSSMPRGGGAGRRVSALPTYTYVVVLLHGRVPVLVVHAGGVHGHGRDRPVLACNGRRGPEHEARGSDWNESVVRRCRSGQVDNVDDVAIAQSSPVASMRPRGWGQNECFSLVK